MKRFFAFLFCVAMIPQFAEAQLFEATMGGYHFISHQYTYKYPKPTHISTYGEVTHFDQEANGHFINFDKWSISFVGISMMRAPGTAWSPFYFADESKNSSYVHGKHSGFFVGDYIAFNFGMGWTTWVKYFNSTQIDVGGKQTKTGAFRGALDLGVLAGYRFEPDKTLGFKWYLSLGGHGLDKNGYQGYKTDLFGRYKRLAANFGFGYKELRQESPVFQRAKEFDFTLYFLEIIRKGWSVKIKYERSSNILGYDYDYKQYDGTKKAYNGFSAGLAFVLF